MLVWYHFFLFVCLETICLIFTYKNIYTVHFYLLVYQIGILNLLVRLVNTQPYSNIIAHSFFLPSPSMVGDFPCNVSKPEHQVTSSAPKGMS